MTLFKEQKVKRFIFKQQSYVKCYNQILMQSQEITQTSLQKSFISSTSSVKTRGTKLYQNPGQNQLIAQIMPVFIGVKKRQIKIKLTDFSVFSQPQGHSTCSGSIWRQGYDQLRKKLEVNLTDASNSLDCDRKLTKPTLVYGSSMLTYTLIFWTIFLLMKDKSQFVFLIGLVCLALISTLIYMTYSIWQLNRIKKQIIKIVQRLNNQYEGYIIQLKPGTNIMQYAYNIVQVYEQKQNTIN